MPDLGLKSSLPAEVRSWDRLRRPIWLYDPVEGRGLYANPPALKLWGAQSLNELLERDFTQLSPAVRSRIDRLAAATAKGEVVTERWSFYPNGRPVTVQAMISAFPIGSCGAALLFEAASIDVQEEELRAVEALRHTSSLISLFDSDGRATFANPAAFAAYGEGGRGFLGRFGDATYAVEAFQAVLDGAVLAELRQVETALGGRHHYLDARQVLDPVTGKPSVLLSERDVTAQVEAERALRTAEERAEVAEAKERFLANMSHELRTPLTSVIGFANLLAGTEVDSSQRTYLNRILEAGQTQLQIINDLIDLSELDGGGVSLAPHPFDPSALLEQALLAAEPAAAAKDLDLELEVCALSPIWLVGDDRRLATVISHFIANAVKFSSQGLITGSIHLAEVGDDAIELEISIADTGPGIEDTAKAQLFRRFAPGDDSSQKRFGGAGLGLAISKALIDLMGGEIGVESEFGHGARFWLRVTLPVHGAVKAHDPTSLEGSRPLRVLYADDHESNRILVKAILESQGHLCDTVNDGGEAVRAVAGAVAYDVVLMDIQMPVQDGLSATREIRARGGGRANLPILALTANTLSEQRQAYALAGLNDCIAKPVNTTELLAAVTRWTEVPQPLRSPQSSTGTV